MNTVLLILFIAALVVALPAIMFAKPEYFNKFSESSEIKFEEDEDPIKVLKPTLEIRNSFNGVTQAWKDSRPHLSGDDLNLHVLKDIDLPVHGFAMYHLNWHGSVAFRDFLYTVRPSNNWATSYRTIERKLGDVHVSSEVPAELVEETREMIREFHRECETKPQDICKNLVPMGAYVQFACVLDLRTLAGLYKDIRTKAEAHLQIYADLLAETIPEILETPTRMSIVDTFSIGKDEARSLAKSLKGKTKVIQNKNSQIVQLQSEVQFVLHAQAIRKQYDRVRSSLPEELFSGEIYKYNQTHKFVIDMYMSKQGYDSLVSARTCWFAMFDKADNSSWSHMLPVNKTTNIEDLIPCKGDCSKCCYEKEQLPRIIGGNTVDYKSKGEANTPCPIMVGNAGVIKIREDKYKPNSEVFKAWKRFGKRTKFKKTQWSDEYVRNIEEYGFAEEKDNTNKDKYLGYLKD